MAGWHDNMTTTKVATHKVRKFGTGAIQNRTRFRGNLVGIAVVIMLVVLGLVHNSDYLNMVDEDRYYLVSLKSQLFVSLGWFLHCRV